MMEGKERQIKKPMSTSFHRQIQKTIDSYRKGRWLGMKKKQMKLKSWAETEKKK